MPTTFNVISLGNFASIDPTEGNTTSENAASLVGLTFGGPGDSLVNDIQSFSPTGSGFGGGTATAYDMNNSTSNDQFSLDGGPAQTFDGTAVYNATITYIDGTTATITAVIFQDTAGNTYLAPEFSANADQAALEAAAIRSLTLDSLAGNTFSGLTGDRQLFNFVTCFAAGTEILTADGPVPVRELTEGDLVLTLDGAAKPVRWIGCTTVAALGRMCPIRIEAGALGGELPTRDLIVSPQHRMLVRSEIARRVSGSEEVLVPAKKLIGLPGIAPAEDMITVDYFHILLDRHEVIFAEDAPTESLLIGPMAEKSLGPEAMEEIQQLFPGIMKAAGDPVRPIPTGKQMRAMVERHFKNKKALVGSELLNP